MTIAQRNLYQGPCDRIERRMYAETEGDVRTMRDDVVLAAGSELSTNTYFGRFPAAYWQRWTGLDTVRLTVPFDVDAAAELRITVRASDSNSRIRPLSAQTLEGRGEAVFELDVRRFVDGGALWWEASAIGGAARLGVATWAVDGVPPRRTAIAICTFNRPAECLATLRSLADAGAEDGVERIIVTDQGDRRVADAPGFGELPAAVTGRLTYLTQPNLGGAGGFSRGMFEATAGADDMDVLFMDDDIIVEPEAVRRIIAFAANTVRPAIVGGQMLLASETSRVHVTGEWESLRNLQPGELSGRGAAGVDALEVTLDHYIDSGWQGWWTCLVPAAVAAECGLPLPLFVQWDDIEYSLRARARGFPIVTLPTAGVWHADFHLKDRETAVSYFDYRNALVVAALHGEFAPNDVGKAVLRRAGKLVAAMQYGLAELYLEAVEEFLSGPDCLADAGRDRLRGFAETRSAFPESALHPMAGVLADADPNLRDQVGEPEPSLEDLVLVKRIVNQLLGRLHHGPAVVGAHDASWWYVAKFDHPIVSDASQTGVHLRRRDTAAAKSQLARAAKLAWRVRREADGLRRRYRAAADALASREAWARRYGIED